jgi:hypothetical protein
MIFPYSGINYTSTVTKGYEHVTAFIVREFHDYLITTDPCCIFVHLKMCYMSVTNNTAAKCITPHNSNLHLENLVSQDIHCMHFKLFFFLRSNHTMDSLCANFVSLCRYTCPTILLLLHVFDAVGMCLPSCCLATKAGKTCMHARTHRLIRGIYEVRS